jgi:hypothetical protein
VIGEDPQAPEMTDDSSGGGSNTSSGKVLTLFDDRGNVGDEARRQHVRRAGLQGVGLRRRQRRFPFCGEAVTSNGIPAAAIIFGWNCALQDVTSQASHISALRLIASGK